MTEPTPLTQYQQTYHWRNKNCGPWARDWIKTNLPGVKVEDGKLSAETAEVTSVSGDCDLGQRKGKLLTIYDMDVTMSWTGTDSSGEEVKGTIQCPEVSHEAIDGLSEYVYEVSSSTQTSSADELVKFVKKSLIPLISKRFDSLRPALLETHGQPGGETPTSGPTSGTSTPAPPQSHYSPAPPTKASAPEKVEEKKQSTSMGKTAVVEVKADLLASAEDLWSLLTDEARIPIWSRAGAQFKPTPGTSYSLFSGNVNGKVVSVDRPTKLVTTWQPRKPNWPSDHFGTMTVTLAQGSDSTTVTFNLEGVPIGQEAEVEQALDSFYIRALKQTGLVISSTSRSYRVAAPSRKKKKRKSKSSLSSLIPSFSGETIGYGVVAALCVGLLGLVLVSFSSR